MTSLNRLDHQLVRQRGTSSRDVNNVDFGFNAGARGLRDDRKLMRQRGAGNRQIGNVDFGFSFPTPDQSRRSSRTPQNAQKIFDGSLKTPRTNSGPPSVAGLNRAGSLEAYQRRTSRQRSSQTPQPVLQVIQPNSGKSRKSKKDTSGFDTGQVVVNIRSFPEPIPQGSERSAVEANEPAAYKQVIPNLNSILPVQDGVLSTNPDKENEHAEPDDSRRSAKRRGSTFRPPRRLSHTNQLEDVVVDLVLPSIESPDLERTEQEFEQDTTAQAVSENVLERFMEAGESTSVHTANLSEHNTTLGDKSSQKKRKRKSVVLRARKRPSTNVARTSSALQAENDVSRVEERSDEIGENTDMDSSEDNEAVSVSDTTRLSRRSAGQQLLSSRKSLSDRIQRRRNRLSATATPPPREEDHEDDDGSYVDGEASPEPVTPAPKKRKKESKRSRARRSDISTETGKESKKNRNFFPIITYRIANVEALPTIEEGDEGDDRSDENSQPLPPTFFNRPHPNAVDILAQICRETITSAIAKIETGSSPALGRSEIKGKKIALEAFSENLGQQLFDMSQAVDHRTNLEARLRKSKRDKADLQARWIEVRRQRDEIALKADTTRRQNWDSEEESKRQWELSELAHKTELEMAREETDAEDLAFLIRHVTGYVSSAGGQGGILNRIKAFNNQLEQMALVLER